MKHFIYSFSLEPGHKEPCILRGQVWILPAGFHGPAPPRVTHQVDVGREKTSKPRNGKSGKVSEKSEQREMKSWTQNHML
jgi:hypothetical protein